MKTNAVLFLIILASVGCRSLEKSFEKGNYERAFVQVQKKILRKEKPKKEDMRLLEMAYSAMNERDLSTIRHLRQSNHSDEYYQIMTIFQRIDQRQDQVQSFIPLLEEVGYNHAIQFVKADEGYEDARSTYLSLLHGEIERHMRASEEHGDKRAARIAYDKAATYLGHDHSDRIDSIRKRARHLGITTVYANVRNHTGMILTNRYHNALVEQLIDTDYWTFSTTDPFDDYDYEIRLHLDDVYFGIEQVRRDRYWDRSFVTELEYQLDQNGNVAKDSLGNDIKIEVEHKVSAKVNVFIQSKNSGTAAVLEILDSSGIVMESFPLQTEVVFNHSYATFRGDRRALSAQSKQLLRNIPVPFPTNQTTFDLSIEQLLPMIQKIMRRETLL